MSQKKNEPNVNGYVSDSFVNTLWDQYEDALDRSRKLRENQYEVYIKTLEETKKFNAEFRNAFKSLYEETKKANENVINSFQLNKSEEELSEENLALRNQGLDVVSRWEKIMVTPIRSSFDIMERLNKRAVENSQAYLENLQKREKERSASSDEYIKLARTTHQKVVRRVEDSFKVLVGSGENKQ